MDINTWILLLAIIEVYIQHIDDPELVKKAAKLRLAIRDGSLVLVEKAKAKLTQIQTGEGPIEARAMRTIIEAEQLVSRKLTAGERIDLLMTNFPEVAEFIDAMLLLSKLDRVYHPR